MMRGLLEKELRQHWLGFTLIIASFPAAEAFLRYNRTLALNFGTPLAALFFELILILPLIVLALSQALVVTEFRHKTQLFLEGLPCPRWAMLLTKYGLGLSVLMLGVTLAVGWAFVGAARSDAMDAHFAKIVGGKTYAWLFFLYSAAFAHAFFGRYRIPIGAGLLLLLTWLGTTGASLGTHAPFSLVQPDFAFERNIFPGGDLFRTCLWGLGFTALGLALGLVRDATVAALLAERMSGREKLTLTFLFLASMVGITFAMETHKNEAPFFVPGSYDVKNGAAAVSVAAAVSTPLPEEAAIVSKIAEEMAAEFAAMAAYLHTSSLPPIFIIHRRDLAGKFENGNLSAKQGVMLRTNLLKPTDDAIRYEPWLIRETLLVHTSRRASREPKGWVLDGFSQFWILRKGEDAARALEWKLATEAAPPDFSVATLQNWLRSRKQMGEERATAFAWSGLEVIRARHGAPAVEGFVAATLGTALPRDARGWWRDQRNSLPSSLRRTVGVSLEELVGEWKNALAKSSPPAAL